MQCRAEGFLGKLVLFSSFNPTPHPLPCLLSMVKPRPQREAAYPRSWSEPVLCPATPCGFPTFVYLWSLGEEFEAGSITSIFSNRAVVKYSRLEDVLHGCSWKINNKLDGTYLPLPVDNIIQRTKQMINKIVQYSLIEGNCEHFVNNLRYGVPRSQQVWLHWL